MEVDNELSEDEIKAVVLKLYPGFDKINGPYLRKDKRKIIILNNSALPSNDPNKRRTLSWPKAIVEARQGASLQGDETVDHIDENKLNDDPSNLQILSRAENARKSAEGNTCLLGYKQSEEHKRSGDKNGMAKITNDKVAEYRRRFASGEMTKRDIISATGMCDKSVRNLLSGKSFLSASGPVTKRKPGRPKS